MTSRDERLGTARQPRQARARERFDAALKEAEALLLEVGLSGFSIPLLAERMDCTRGSLYAYFATPNALLNELATRYLSEIAIEFSGSNQLSGLPWRRGIETGVTIAADFYNRRPVARLIILGGAVTDFSFRAQEITIKRIGDLGRAAWQARGIRLPTEPDVTTLAIDLGMACFRRSVFAHGEITPLYRATAADVMNAFLAPYVEPASPKKRAK